MNWKSEILDAVLILLAVGVLVYFVCMSISSDRSARYYGLDTITEVVR